MSDAAKPVAAPFLNNGGEGEAVTSQANLEVCWRIGCNAPNQPAKRAWRDMAERCRLLVFMARSEQHNVVVDDRGTSELELGDLIRHFCSNPLTFHLMNPATGKVLGGKE